MCLAIPAKIVELEGDNAVFETNGVRRPCNVSFIHEPKIGEWVLVHAGFAIQKWSEEDLQEFNAITEEMQKLDR